MFSSSKRNEDYSSSEAGRTSNNATVIARGVKVEGEFTSQGDVIIEGEVPVGEMVPVRISGAMAYDLSGTVETKAAQVVGA